MILAFVIVFGLLFLGLPIAFVLAYAGFYLMNFQSTIPLTALIQRMFAGVDSFPLMAIPFFILAGSLMNTGGLTQKLLDFSNILVGFMRGGLASVSIVASMVFAGISGSSVADASGIGSILIPAMKKQGYSSEYSAAINATSSTIGIIIPPSIPMVLLGATASISIRDLFLGGAFPGLLVGLSMLGVSLIIAYHREYPKSEESYTVKEALLTILNCIPAVIMPVLIIGGIIFGVFTPTEAAVIAVAYSFIFGVFFYKEIKFKHLKNIFIETGIQTSIVLLIISTASIISYFLSYNFIPQAIAAWSVDVLKHQTVILLFISGIGLLVGMFIDVTPALILLGSVFTPMVVSIGIDPVHYGLVLITSLAVGLYTPPVGTTLIISSYIAETKVHTAFTACIPFLICELFVLLLEIVFPPLTTFLPNLLFH